MIYFSLSLYDLVKVSRSNPETLDLVPTRNTKDQWLVYGESDLRLMGFTDFSFQSDHDDSKSVSRFIFTLNSGAVCWKSFKQHTVADSVCEVEYVAASDAAKEVV